MKKIGILTCSNAARVLDCPVGACLKDMYERKGAFRSYENNEVELVGINSCNGCPTLAGESTILPKIESLVYYGAESIHVSYCMTVLCPFVKKYSRVIKEKFQNIDLIQGTHEPHQTNKKFRCDTANLLKERRKAIIP